MSRQTAFVFFLLALAAVYSLEDGFAFATSAKGRKLKFVGDSLSPVYLPLLNEDRDPAAGTFKILGEVATGRPCCTSWGTGRVDCFIRNNTADAKHFSKENGKYTDWKMIGGYISSDLACVSRTPGIIDVLAAGVDLKLYAKTYSGGKWTKWDPLVTAVMKRPSCVARTATNIDCTVSGTKNQAINIDQVDGKWGKLMKNGGYLSDFAKAVARTADTTDYWHVGTGSRMYQMQRVAGKWTNWINHKGALRGPTEAISLGPNRYHVFASGVESQFMHLEWNGAWQAWKDLGGTIVDAPSCVGVGDMLHCFVVQMDSYLYRRYYDGKVWSDWFCAYGSFLESPKCVVSNIAKKEVSCYLRGFNRKVIEVVYNL